MLRKVLAWALAMVLVLGLAFPLSAAREVAPLARATKETRVIVQLAQNPVLVYEAQQKDKGLYSAKAVENYANSLKKNMNNVISQARSHGIALAVEAQYTHTFFGFSAGVPFSNWELEKLPGVKRVSRPAC